MAIRDNRICIAALRWDSLKIKPARALIEVILRVLLMLFGFKVSLTTQNYQTFYKTLHLRIIPIRPHEPLKHQDALFPKKADSVNTKKS